MRIRSGFVALLVGAVVTVPAIASGDEPLAATERVSVGVGGALPDGASIYAPSVSNEGRYVAFTSQASNLVPGDTNGQEDAFVYDRLTKTTEMVSVSSSGFQANDDSVFPVITTDGRYVAFHSIATNLVAGDINGPTADVFLHDRVTKQTTLISRTSGGVSGAGHSVDPNFSPDGRYLAYFSGAGDIAPGDTNGGVFDILVYDMTLGTTSRVSVGAPIPLVGLVTGTTVANGDNFAPAISAGGRFVAFHAGAANLVIGDTNGSSDVFVHDRLLVHTTRVSTQANGNQANGDSAFPVISSDGRYVAFHSAASNLVPNDTNGKVDVFVKDTVTGAITRVTSNGAQGNGDTLNPAMSIDGTWVAVYSHASNFVAGDTNGVPDVFVWNRHTGLVTRMSINTAETQGNGASNNPGISPEGRFVAFISEATNLQTPDNNGYSDVYVRNIVGRVEGAQPPPTPPIPPLPPVPPPPGCVPFDPFETTVGDLIRCGVNYLADQI